MSRKLEFLTLPLRALVLLFLLYGAYYFGSASPIEDYRKESAETGVVAKYSRSGEPWRIFYDRDRDRQWDMWIDQRGGPPYIVSIDDNRDGDPDRDEDEFGNPISARGLAQLRAEKTFFELLNNPTLLQYAGLAVMMYTLLEFAARSLTA